MMRTVFVPAVLYITEMLKFQITRQQADNGML
jgi:hypothetical protein